MAEEPKDPSTDERVQAYQRSFIEMTTQGLWMLWQLTDAAKNFIEAKVNLEGFGDFVVTFQRLEGKSPNDLRVEAEEARDYVEAKLRQELWLNHGCPNAALYGDDGEMQCNNMAAHPGFYDFKRTPISEVCERVEEARRARIIKELGY
jgi:hypothetical protein